MSARQPGENQNQLEAIIFLYHLQVQLARKQIRKRGSVAEEAEQEIQLTENNGVDECNEGKKSGPAKSARAKGKVVRLTFCMGKWNKGKLLPLLRKSLEPWDCPSPQEKKAPPQPRKRL